MTDERASLSEARPAWFDEMEPFDALLHIANALHSLLYGVEDAETLSECQNAADVWMKDVVQITRIHRFNTEFVPNCDTEGS